MYTEKLTDGWTLDNEQSNYEDLPDFFNIKQEIFKEGSSQYTRKLKSENSEQECVSELLNSKNQLNSSKFLLLEPLKLEATEKDEVGNNWNIVEEQCSLESKERSLSSANSTYQTLNIPLVRNLRKPVLWKAKSVEDSWLKCDLCNYETNQTYNLKRHQLRHKHTLEDHELFNCYQCGYKTIDKSCLTRHLRQHNSEKVEKFKCAQCNYETLQKSGLKRHQLRHENPDKIDRFQCNQCKYNTIYKSHLTRHYLQHKDPDDAKIFKCSECDFRTTQNSHLKTHFLRHAKPEEVDVFKCDICSYQTIHKRSLKTHHLRHANPEEVKNFKCNKCNYQSIYKSSLNTHFLHHADPDEIEKFKSSQTIYKSCSNKHLTRHVSPENV